MAGTNDIKLFAGDATNILSVPDYTADAQRLSGNLPGVARSPLVNRAMRQSSLVTTAVADLIARVTNQNVVDSGNTVDPIAAQTLALLLQAGYVADTGVVNAYVVTLDPAPTAYTEGMRIRFVTPNANTGASTINVNALGVVALTKRGTSALTGGEIPANSVVDAVYRDTGFQIVNVDVLATVNTWSAAQRGAIVALTDGATITPNFNLSNNFSLAIGGNPTLANPSNQIAGQGGVIVITQDVTGGRVLAFGSNWKFENGTVPSLTPTPLAVDVLVYYVESVSRITARLITDVK